MKPSLSALALSAFVIFTVATSPAGPGRPASSAADSTLTLVDSAVFLDVVAREPMVVEFADGTLLVAGYGIPGPKLWRSGDRGATWSRVAVGTKADGAVGNSDVDLAVASDGTIYFVQMAFDRSVGEGTQISVGASTDGGATWRWRAVSTARFDDRPWVAIAPDGTAHLIWNDGKGVRHAVTSDRGETWKELDRVHTAGGSSAIAIGPKREVAVRVTPISASGHTYSAGVDLIAVSADGGKTFIEHAAPGEREWSPLTEEPIVPRWAEPLAWDARGALYSLWTNRKGLWLARSSDLGATWTTWMIGSNPQVMYYPYLIARGDGELGASWFSGWGDSLEAHVARIQVAAAGSAPRVVEARPYAPETWGWSARKEDPKVRDTAGEYLAIAFLRDGSLGAVSPVQNEREGRFGFEWRRYQLR